MKQRIRVVGLLRNSGNTLFLKRSQGRAEELPKYELPAGKISFGEQPEEAMTRLVYDNLGVKLDSVKLLDVITFVNLQGSSELANLYIVYEIKINDAETLSVNSERFSKYRWESDSEDIPFALDEASLAVLDIIRDRTGNVVKNTEYRGEASFATIYVDGGSRGNPGPSGVGYYIVSSEKEVLKRGGEFLGFSTSRLAEYYALKEGIEQAIELGLRSVHFMSDSLMVVNQMNGVYRVKNRDLTQVYDDIWKLLEKLDSYSFTHVRRDQNKEADREVNRAIDSGIKRR